MEKRFAYFFGIYIKFGYKNASILTPLDSVDVASKAELLVKAKKEISTSYYN